MGTHPIFESDFDCLTEMSTVRPNAEEQAALQKYIEPSDYLIGSSGGVIMSSPLWIKFLRHQKPILALFAGSVPGIFGVVYYMQFQQRKRILESIENGNYEKTFPNGEFKIKMIEAAKEKFGIEQKIEHQVEHQFTNVENEKKISDEIWNPK